MLQLFVACCSLCVADTTRLLLFVKPTIASYSCLITLFGFILASTETEADIAAVVKVCWLLFLFEGDWVVQPHSEEVSGSSPMGDRGFSAWSLDIVHIGSPQVLPQLGDSWIAALNCA